MCPALSLELDEARQRLCPREAHESFGCAAIHALGQILGAGWPVVQGVDELSFAFGAMLQSGLAELPGRHADAAVGRYQHAGREFAQTAERFQIHCQVAVGRGDDHRRHRGHHVAGQQDLVDRLEKNQMTRGMAGCVQDVKAPGASVRGTRAQIELVPLVEMPFDDEPAGEPFRGDRMRPNRHAITCRHSARRANVVGMMMRHHDRRQRPSAVKDVEQPGLILGVVGARVDQVARGPLPIRTALV